MKRPANAGLSEASMILPKAIRPRARSVNNFLLVLSPVFGKLNPTMKRKLSFVVLLGLAIGAILCGCNQSSENKPTQPDTNAAPAAPSTNAP
jgi:hypothetical protein